MVIHGEVVGEDRLRWSLEYRAMMCVGWCVCVFVCCRLLLLAEWLLNGDKFTWRTQWWGVLRC
jgi:hypothetical protein